METILDVTKLSKSFAVKGFLGKNKGAVSAVDQVSFSLRKRGTLGIVGESGCGKSTLARLLMRLIEPDQGEVKYREQNILSLSGSSLKSMRQKMQMVFQNPYSSLNPKMTNLDNIAFSLWANGKSKQESRQLAYQYIEAVGLSKAFAERFPHHLSGGQRQRVAIARALILKPEIVIADESVSALDKSVQAQVLNLFQELKQEFALSFIFISHDLHVVEYMSDEVMVMYLGRVVEKGPTAQIFNSPYHPYTQALLQSAPSMDAEVSSLDSANLLYGEMPSPLNPPSGCRFRTRCPYAEDRCASATPPLIEVSPGHEVSCFLHEKVETNIN